MEREHAVQSERENVKPVELAGLGRRYKGRVAISDVDLSVSYGEVVGLVGPNGAGKSTLLKMIAGLTRPSEGSGVVMGVRLGNGSRRMPFIGLMPEHPAFIESLSGWSNLRALASIRGETDDEAITHTLELVGLSVVDRRPARAYSQGMRQRLSLAQAILEGPQVLLLDEPTNGLDPQGIVDMRGFIRRLADEGRAVLVSSHLLSEVEAVCDRVLLVQDGRIIGVYVPGDHGSHLPVFVQLAVPGHRTILAAMPGVSRRRWMKHACGSP